MKKSLFLFAMSVLSAAAYSQKTVSLETLLREMTDRTQIARFPDPAFVCKQSGSTDPATVAKDQPGWFGNGDCTNFIRSEHTANGLEHVMLEDKGPGAVVRFWMTFAGEGSGNGTLRIYVDGQEKPVIEGNARAILSKGAIAGAPFSQGLSTLSEDMRRGFNLYFPIPYAAGCRITYQSDMVNFDDRSGITPGNEAVFYNINYRSYASGTKVESFSADQLHRYGKTIERSRKALAENDRDLKGLKLRTTSLDADIPAGGRTTFSIAGQQAIRRLAMSIEAAHKEQALRSTVLEISFDGERTVWTPIGDFYGIGYMPLYTNTWYFRTEPGGKMEAFWVMPFREKCEITLHNYGAQPVRVVNAEAQTAPWKWDNSSMHFGTSWHQYTGIWTGRDKHLDTSEIGGPVDLSFVSLKGKGVYAGDGIALFNTDYAWWGEGDEKVYVDGETFPSHLGTGTEDYYGYAWGRPETIVDHPFIAQPDGRGAWLPAFVQNTRLRSLDAIPFNTSLTFDMELWHHYTAVINYAPVTYWYMLPGGRSEVAPDIEGALHRVALKREDIIPPRIEISVEAEHMAIEDQGNTTVHYHHHGMPHKDIWSNCMHLFWHSTEKGEALTLGFDSALEGHFDLTLLCTFTPHYGTLDISVNGKDMKKGMSLHGGKTMEVLPVELGSAYIRKGRNTISFRMADFAPGHNDGMAGIDKLILNIVD